MNNSFDRHDEYEMDVFSRENLLFSASMDWDDDDDDQNGFNGYDDYDRDYENDGSEEEEYEDEDY